MKIIIADDDDEKIKRIEEEIKDKFHDENILISVKKSIIDVKQDLVKNYYDLLILDLNMPLFEEGECKEEAGYDLYNELKKLRQYKMPGNIMFCTSHKNLYSKYEIEVQQGLFSIITYESVKNEWIITLIDKIFQILQAIKDSKEYESKYNYDVGIITAVEIENLYVLDMINNQKKIFIEGDPTIYIQGDLCYEDRILTVICATQYQMGMTASSTLSMKLISNFKPKVLAMVGIAAGKKGKGNLGDIIAATQVWDYSSGKISTDEDENNNFLFMPSPQYLPVDVHVKELLNDDYSEILSRIKNKWKHSKINTSLNLVKGSMACGPAVIQNESIVREYIDPHNRNVVGIDMESYGVLFAGANAIEPKPIVLVFKSLCDFGDSSKNDEYQNYAAYTSSKFLYYFLFEKYFS